MEALIEQKLEQHFGFAVAQITRMIGYESNNYKADTPDGSFVCKLHDIAELDHLSAETHLLLYLQDNFTYDTPIPIPIDANSWFVPIEHQGNQYIMRVLSYVEGQLYAENQGGVELWSSLGLFTARFHRVLKDFRSYEIEAREYHWDLSKAHLNLPKMKYIPASEDRKYVKHFMHHFEHVLRPKLHTLPAQIIQNDGNDWNILTHHQDVTGIIDFGDVCFAPRICDIAITLTYVMLDVDQPLQVAESFLTAYCSEEPLSAEEVDVLFYFIGLRLSVSVLNSAYGRVHSPKNHYLIVSERGAWNLLRKWCSMNPIDVQHRFRKVCDLDLPAASSMSKLLEQRKANFPHNLSLAYSPSPITMSGALFQYMFDDQGKSYLDLYNNIPHVGHQHPEVLEAIEQQLRQLNTNSRYLHPMVNKYAGRLLQKFQAPIQKIVLLNDGSAASDLAIRIARNHCGKNDVMVIQHGYHGHTSLGIEISNYKHGGPGGLGTTESIHVLPLPDLYRHPEQVQQQTEQAVALIHQIKPACIIAESIVGCGGQVPLPKTYIQAIYAAVREHGGVCIADEVQTGFGRTGQHFWAFEHFELQPDMVVMGKSMGNGHPIAALALSNELAASFDTGMEFFSSYGANPVSCAAGMAVLNVIESSKLQENSLILGAYFKDQLETMAMDFDVLGEVRGQGLFLGVDIINNSEEKMENPELASQLKKGLKNLGILVGTDGPKDNVIKIKPPMCIEQENIDHFLDVFQKILRK